MPGKLRLLGGAAIFLVVAGLVAFFYGKNAGGEANAQIAEGGENQGPPPAVVEVAAAQSRTLAPLSEAPGSVVSTRDSLIAAATSGKVEWVANVGDEVNAGDVIARIEKTDAELTRNDRAADIRRLKSRADYLDRTLQRFVSLGEDSGESEAAIDEMRANAQEARQALAQAEVALARAQIDLERTDVTAPFDGRIVTQEIQVGEFANPGAPIARVVDTKNLEVTARAPATLALNIDQGDSVAVQYGDETVEAPVRAVVPVGDDLSRMLELRLALPGSEWYIGSAVRVRLPTEEPRQATAVHRDALILRAAGVSVFVVAEDNKAKQVPVELGAADGDYIEVIGDIEAGARVIVRGGERLRDGQMVEIAARNTPLGA